MSNIDWSIGNARYLMNLIVVTKMNLCQILVQENDNMSIRHLTLHGKNITEHINKEDINKLQYTIITFLSFADALRRSDHIFVRL